MVGMTDLKQVREALEELTGNGTIPLGLDSYEIHTDTVEKCCKALTLLDGKVMVDGWQPMNTAPKDGTEILVWRDDSGSFIARHTDGYGVIPEHEQDEEWCTEETLEHEGWWSDAYGRQEGPETPTHWMPIPTGPDLHHRKEENESD